MKSVFGPLQTFSKISNKFAAYCMLKATCLEKNLDDVVTWQC